MVKNTQKRDYIGTISLVVGIIGTAVTIIFSINYAAEWKDYALIGSGWTAALLFALHLWRATKVSESTHQSIGNLQGELLASEERIKNLEEELKRCNAISHFLATLDRPQSAKPRVTNRKTKEENNGN